LRTNERRFSSATAPAVSQTHDRSDAGRENFPSLLHPENRNRKEKEENLPNSFAYPQAKIRTYFVFITCFSLSDHGVLLLKAKMLSKIP
jgi:hypothetical protein